nr:aminotransferase class IV [Spirochaetota bacterium]
TVPVHAKSAGNYINAYLALSDAQRRGFNESILLDTGGFVAEGGTSNIFIVKRGAVMTPTLRSILPGITRMFILDILKGVLECAEHDITVEDLKQADEAFFSNSVERVMPVLSIDGAPLGAPCPGPFTERVIREIASVIEGRNSAFARWLTPVA